MKVHYFGGIKLSEWPGEDMTLVKGNIYKFDLPAGTNGVVFNDGNGSQMDDISPNGGHLYALSGDKGEYVPDTTPEKPVVPEKLYLMGSVNGNIWNTEKPVVMTKTGNVFTANDVMFVNGTEDDATFSFSTLFGASWDVVNSGDRYGAAEENTAIVADTPAVMTRYIKDVNASSCKSWKVAKGQYNVKVDFDANTVTLTKVAAGSGTLSAADVKIKANGEATLSISLTNSKTIAGLVFDVKYPDNVTSGTPTLLRTTSATMKAEVSKQTDGSYRYVVYDGADLKGFSGNEGVIMQIPLKANAAATVGEYPLTFTNVQYSTPSGELVRPGDFNGKMIVEASEVASYLELNYKILSLKVGGTQTLIGKIMPGETAAERIVWTSDNSSIATVSNTGVVTAVANGKATITATVGEMKAVCDVYVGKEAQTISWGEVPAKLVAGEEFTLNAVSTSNLPISYSIVEGSTYAHIENGKLVAEKIGNVTIEASQAGNDTYAPANPVTATITIWLGHDMGDVNMDDVINIEDVTTAVEHILGNKVLEGNAFTLADMNGNEEIDIADVVLIVNSILTQPVAASHNARAMRVAAAAIEQFEMTPIGNLLNIRFSNMHNYVATQFVLTLPADVEVVSGQVVGSDHFAAVNNLGEGKARVVVYSLNNETFNDNGTICVKLSQSGIKNADLSEALVGTPDTSFAAAGASFDNVNTGIEAIMASYDANEVVSVYDLNGVCIYNGTLANFANSNLKGAYVVKTAEAAVKVIL